MVYIGSSKNLSIFFQNNIFYYYLFFCKLKFRIILNAITIAFWKAEVKIEFRNIISIAKYKCYKICIGIKSDYNIEYLYLIIKFNYILNYYLHFLNRLKPLSLPIYSHFTKLKSIFTKCIRTLK